MSSQICTKCKLSKDYSLFSKDKSKKLGIHSVCKECQKIQKAGRKDKAKLVRKAHYERTKELSSKYHKEKNAKPEVKLKFKEKHLKKSYNLSLEDLEQLKISQKYRCAICNTHEDDCSRKTLFVDHNHTTGEVRGLLCSQCNSALGLFYDDTELLASAIKYLVK